MAVFMLNVCKFNACGLTFKSLGHLIQHIEETHIDYDPHVVERTEQQQPPSIPLSYVLRFLTDAARRENAKPAQPTRPSQSCLSASGRVKSLTPTGSEAEEGEDFVSDPDDSNDSWATLEEFSTDFILRYGSRTTSQGAASKSGHEDKPFACPVPGCKKRYKNVNGIKYHSKNGHKNDGKVRKAFKCGCGKSYKTPYGLKNHTAVRHGGSAPRVKRPHAARQMQHHPYGGLEHRRHHHHHHHHHHHSSSSSSSSSRSHHFGKPAKVKVSAIQDHGYIKQERFGEPESDYDPGNLGVLTPASSPPLQTPSPAKAPNADSSTFHKYLLPVNSSQTQQGTVMCDN